MAANTDSQHSDDDSKPDLCSMKLTLYPARNGAPGEYWARELDEVVTIPLTWEFLPPGDAYITRMVKQGPHWERRDSFNRKRGYTKRVGIFAPKDAIKAAREKAEETKEVREKRRDQSRRYRERVDQNERELFEKACIDYLDFAPEHKALAESIASCVAAHAHEKGSGRVGRSRQLSLEDRASAAVRAYIRHKHTDYDEQFKVGFSVPDEIYRGIKRAYNDKVDEFLKQHRRRSD